MTQDTTSAIPRGTGDEEIDEWLESWEGLVNQRGTLRAAEIMEALRRRAASNSVAQPKVTTTDYVNTIQADQEPAYPGDERLERKYRKWLRWNAAMLVHRAQRPEISVGGHISTYAGAATLYEIGFNNFFRGQNHPGGGDQVFFQGHASPGMYARAYLENRLSDKQLDGFRQEASKAPNGLSSYPHPRLMPDFWQFPTVSMGLGPIN
ncbi:MAG: pyruvate dehydrogenase (acetyl-transferring), homodimeric type, partial [Brevibacterium aurantiacum]|nr:pyruvate dehydrogenase (acetyl-transferring), homodimeric type [Brevibacterium aurantiacum]